MQSLRPRFRSWFVLSAPAVAVAVLLALSACSSERSSDWSQLYGVAAQLFGARGAGITLEQAAAIPFASIGVRINDGPEGVLVLATSNASGERLWTSASRVALLTRAGRIVRSAGLEHNLSESRVRSGYNGPPPFSGSATSVWEDDFADLNLYSVAVSCTSKVQGPAIVKNFTRDIPTIQVDESCRSDQLDWSFVNSYWISPATGAVWRSIQYVSPKLGPIEIEILRPVGTG